MLLVRCAPRALAFLLAAGLALTLAACGGTPSERPAPPAPSTATEPPAAAEPTAPSTPTLPAATPSPSPTATPKATETPAPTATATPSPTSTATPSPTAITPQTALRYNTFDRTGTVSTSGSYAFLMPDGQARSVVTTYEQLRTESTVMRVNAKDEHGASWGDFYDAVVVGDVVEWRQADDCWARYQVTSAPQPAGGAVSRELGVRWVTYAARGCTGAISGYAVASLNLNPPLAVKSSEITVPVRHGPYLLVPSGWTGGVEDAAPVPTPSDTGASRAADASPTATTAPWEVTFDLVEARRHPYWRDPELPGGWTFAKAEANYEGIDGYIAFYLDSLGGLGLEYQVARNFWQPREIRAVDGMSIHELRLIDGRPAVVRYSPSGNLTQVTKALIFDEASGIDVIVVGVSPRVGGSPAIVITVARSLLPE